MLRLDSFAATLLLAGLVAMGPLATDMYLPALPAITDALGATPGEVQLTLSVYLVGFACAQLIYGPLGDRFGRKPILLGGICLFALASAGCALVESIEAMIALRFLQALGGASGPVLARAAVRDVHDPLEAARIMSYLGTAMALAPAVAPTLGGFLLVTFGWPAVFLGLVAYSVIAALLLFAIPEPLPPERRQSIHPVAILRNYRTLLGSREYLGYTFTNTFVFSGLFAFISGASFVLIEFLGIPEDHFGFYFVTLPTGYMTGTLIGGRFSRRLGVNRLLMIGTTLCALGGAAMAFFALTHVFTKIAVLGPMLVYMIGIGIVMPQSMAGAIGPFPSMAGSASALFGFIQMGIAAVVGAGVGQLHDGTSRTMAVTLGVMGLLGLATFVSTVLMPGRESQTTAQSIRG